MDCLRFGNVRFNHQLLKLRSGTRSTGSLCNTVMIANGYHFDFAFSDAFTSSKILSLNESTVLLAILFCEHRFSCLFRRVF
jgi:hypothetical protein